MVVTKANFCLCLLTAFLALVHLPVGELLSELNNQHLRLRQALIDEELFDVISGFESLKKTPKK